MGYKYFGHQVQSQRPIQEASNKIIHDDKSHNEQLLGNIECILWKLYINCEISFGSKPEPEDLTKAFRLILGVQARKETELIKFV